MLTPTQLDKLPESMIQLMAELQDDILNDLCRRIVKSGGKMTATAEWQLYKANQLQLSSKEVNRRIAQKLKKRESALKEIYTDAVKEAIREDAKIYRMAISEGKLSEDCGEKLTSYTRSVAFNNVLRQGLKNTNSLMRNLTNSTAAMANRQLSDALDLAYLKTISGAFTPAQAIFEAVQKLGADGIKTVSYTSGRTDQVDVAVRRAVVTGIGKTCCDMQLGLAAEMDCDLVEVSSHIGARPSHAEWQGQIYSLKKGNPKYPYFFDATGYGTGDGLGGWNCRHSFFPYFEGISEAANATDFSSEENIEVYNNEQRQRALERNVRKSKRELAAIDGARSAASDPALISKLDRAFEKKSVTLKNREAALTEHCKKTGTYIDTSRVRVDGFGKSVSQKAVWANKKSFSNSVLRAPTSSSNEYNVFVPEDAVLKFKLYIKSMNDFYSNAYSRVLDNLNFETCNDENITFGYLSKTDTIYYNPFNPNIKYYDSNTVLLHELAHRYDVKYVNSAENGYFSQAINDGIINADRVAIAADYNGKTISKNPYLSDILSALCENDSSLKLRYNHSNEEYRKYGVKEREIFSNLFALEATKEKDCISFLDKHFPSIISEFEIMRGE